MIENMIDFKVCDKPQIRGYSDFPYEKLMRSLEILEETKCVIFDEKEITTNNISYLNKSSLKVLNRGIKSHRKNGKVHLWMRREE